MKKRNVSKWRREFAKKEGKQELTGDEYLDRWYVVFLSALEHILEEKGKLTTKEYWDSMRDTTRRLDEWYIVWEK